MQLIKPIMLIKPTKILFLLYKINITQPTLLFATRQSGHRERLGDHKVPRMFLHNNILEIFPQGACTSYHG